jgi:cardiolipin synthase
MIYEYVDGNRLVLLESGQEYFPALEAAIRDARYEVYLETYIFADDPTGRRIGAALADAVERGVAVHVLVDGFGSKAYFGDLHAELLAAGIQVLVYRPDLTRWNFRRNRLRRMHRKLAVIDGRVGFVGGINIIDDMNTPRHTPPRYDYAVRVEGPLLTQMQQEVEHLWSLVAWVSFRQRWRAQRNAPVDATPRGHQRAALLVRDNLRHRSDIEDAYLSALQSAEEEIVIAVSYFFPGRRFRRALLDAAQRGVRVSLLLQARVEYRLLHYASRAIYGALLEGGVDIVEYHKSFMHAKVAVVDGRWATVGSSNIDPFSLLLAREANLAVDDRRFSLELRASLQRAMNDGAKPVARERWARLPLWNRVVIWGAYGLARGLIGLAGYAGKL